MKTVNSIWKNSLPDQLAFTLTSISDEQVMRNVLRDVLTEKEIIEISARLEAARLLSSGTTYSEISKQTKLSSRTVARISEWLKDGANGYPAAISFIEQHHAHTPPARVS